MPIYTKRGDKGKTGVLEKERISKSSPLIEAIGTVDELNSYLGTIGGFEKVQADLFTINAVLARAKIHFSKSKTTRLEKEIDILEKKLPRQKNFIYYNGYPKATSLFYARSICRRAERSLVVLSETSFVVDASILAYVNRLSDYLYIRGREVNFKAGVPEKAWRG